MGEIWKEINNTYDGIWCNWQHNGNVAVSGGSTPPTPPN